ncbi:MAG: hypothetical protein EBU90_01785 [Proteobacteria bacterium]|nr:hypothetical protein [Pseudomonadota bacterium]
MTIRELINELEDLVELSGISDSTQIFIGENELQETLVWQEDLRFVKDVIIQSTSQNESDIAIITIYKK